MEVSNNQNGASSGRDGLSSLSDCLLHTILSHLKALQVVRTCLLSRRWSQGSSPFDELRDHEIEEVLFGKREDIVDNLLLHHSTRLLHTLRLRIHIDDQTAPCVRRWIRRALSCAPAVLVIHYGTSIMLPPRSSGTRCLTKLCLDQVSLHGGFEEQITTGLPVLEDLRIKNS
ncbi:MEIOTIC F-BOX protein MOF-like [Lolium perenne]|uniref:MEIOTIC F-BOX protein MOF-like n=1 Tax=Lolium perenne TaxID=4522 RepID=UPI0021F5CC94|nr:MEIOTIC F-BOX protein MOF-like [Lolium perenne]